MNHNITRPDDPSAVRWQPAPMNDADRVLVLFVKDVIGLTREYWPTTLPDEVWSIQQWWQMSSDEIARLCNYMAGLAGMIDRDPDGDPNDAALIRRAEQKLTVLLGAVLRVEDQIKGETKC